MKTLDNWGEQILNYFNQRTTQGFVEGINNKIKLIKRRGYPQDYQFVAIVTSISSVSASLSNVAWCPSPLKDQEPKI